MTPYFQASRFIIVVAIGLFATMTATAAKDDRDTARIEHQRELFRDVFSSVERGDWAAVENLPDRDKQLLEQYVLWPDLRATWLRVNIATVSATEVESFVSQFGILRPVRELRYRYALNFVSNNDLAGYLQVYEQFYQGQAVEKLDCLALQAEILAGRDKRVEVRAVDLWLVGKSQVDECNPVFDYLHERRLLGIVEYRQRFDLAVAARNFSLAGWLAKKIDEDHVASAAQWQEAQSNPRDFLAKKRRRSGDEVLREQLVYATERLGYRDPLVAYGLWEHVSTQHNFSEAQKLATAQHIALWIARDNAPGAYGRLSELPPAAQSDEVLRWRARVSLRENRWDRLLTDIALMSDSERDSEEWRYWRAIAQMQLGESPEAAADLELLGHERSFYGFLAADKLGTDYAFDHTGLTADETRIAALESRNDVIRARELFYVGQEGRGRSEWDSVVRTLPVDDKIQAVILAHRWGWHSRAIAAAGSLRQYDDLSIRYPLPYQEDFESFSSQASIASTWAYGIARSESLFMRDVRSSAGAIGLMQIMPATGRDVASAIRVPYTGLATLVDPESNIRLGTSYLGQMSKRYDGNQVLATAAYNAGPHRVDRWLPDDGTVDALIWIENIPFNETRQYVKRVLAAQAIFHWRMTGETRRLKDELLLVRALSESLQVASR
jgi:soluble lytic murein transglycosylase